MSDIQFPLQDISVLHEFSLQTNYTNWAENQPNNNGWIGEQDCVEIRHTMNAAGVWNDEDCTLVSRFICEKTAKDSTKGKIIFILLQIVMFSPYLKYAKSLKAVPQRIRDINLLLL